MANRTKATGPTSAEASPVASALAEGDLGAAASEATGTIQDAAGKVVDQVRQQATGQLTAQKDRAAEGLELAAQLLRQAGEQVRGQDQAMVAQYLDGAADQVQRFSGEIRNQDLPQLMESTERLARRQPALFVGGALALGFLGARFLKSSARQVEEDDASGVAAGMESSDQDAYLTALAGTSRAGDAAGRAEAMPEPDAWVDGAPYIGTDYSSGAGRQ